MDVPEEELNRRIDEEIRRILCQKFEFWTFSKYGRIIRRFGWMYVFCNKPNPPLIRVAGTKERITWSYLHKVKLQNQVRLYTSQSSLW